jgi:hypothetical protein
MDIWDVAGVVGIIVIMIGALAIVSIIAGRNEKLDRSPDAGLRQILNYGMGSSVSRMLFALMIIFLGAGLVSQVYWNSTTLTKLMQSLAATCAICMLYLLYRARKKM